VPEENMKREEKTACRSCGNANKLQKKRQKRSVKSEAKRNAEMKKKYI